LTGCAGPQRAKDINANLDSYLDKEFTIAYVSPGLRSKINDVGLTAPSPAKEITMKFNQRVKLLGDQTEKIAQPEFRLRNLGGGYYQDIRDIQNNGYLATRFVYLTWAGLLPLKAEQLASDRDFPIPTGEVKDITPFKFNPSQLKTGDRFNYEFKIGSRPQAFNLGSERADCVVDNVAPASQLHRSVPGTGVWISCDMAVERGQPSKNKAVFLVDYGYAVFTEFRSPSRTSTYELIDFAVK